MKIVNHVFGIADDTFRLSACLLTLTVYTVTNNFFF